MAKKLLLKALSVLVFIAALTLYILYNLTATFAFFNLSVCIMILFFGLGAISLYKSVVSKINIYLIVAGILITAGLIIAGFNFNILPADKAWLYFPIAIGLLLVFVFFRYLFNIKKWDIGDNEKSEYNNYHERQADKEKLDSELMQKEKEKTMMDIENKQKEKDKIKKN